MRARRLTRAVEGRIARATTGWLSKSDSRKSNGGTEGAGMETPGQMPAPSPGDGVPPGGGHDYPLTFSVDYPDRRLNRISTAFRIFAICLLYTSPSPRDRQ